MGKKRFAVRVQSRVRAKVGDFWSDGGEWRVVFVHANNSRDAATKAELQVNHATGRNPLCRWKAEKCWPA